MKKMGRDVDNEEISDEEYDTMMAVAYGKDVPAKSDDSKEKS